MTRTATSPRRPTDGFDIWDFGDDFTGNGNDFGLGRDGGAHVLKNCLAWGNRVRGFDANVNTGRATLYNCTGWDNDHNFVFYGARLFLP